MVCLVWYVQDSFWSILAGGGDKGHLQGWAVICRLLLKVTLRTAMQKEDSGFKYEPKRQGLTCSWATFLVDIPVSEQ